MNYIGNNSKIGFVKLVLVTVMLFSLFTSPVAAVPGQPLEVKRLDLQISPEYDDPRVLAIWDGTLTNTSDKPFSGLVSFNIPKDVEINMACEIVNGGGHSCQPYKLEDKGDYQVISWRTTKSIAPGTDYPFWLEYYYNPIQGYPDKTMTVDYTPFYNTQNLSLTVKEPLNSTNFKIDPDSSVKTSDNEGFNNYTYVYQGLQEGNPVQLMISYTRSDKNTSVQPPQKPDYSQQSSSTGTTSEKPFFSSFGGLILVGVTVVGVVLGIIYFTDSNKKLPVSQGTSRKKISKGNKQSGETVTKNTSPEEHELRQMLRDGEISEETYRELVDKLE